MVKQDNNPTRISDSYAGFLYDPNGNPMFIDEDGIFVRPILLGVSNSGLELMGKLPLNEESREPNLSNITKLVSNRYVRGAVAIFTLLAGISGAYYSLGTPLHTDELNTFGGLQYAPNSSSGDNMLISGGHGGFSYNFDVNRNLELNYGLWLEHSRGEYGGTEFAGHLLLISKNSNNINTFLRLGSKFTTIPVNQENPKELRLEFTTGVIGKSKNFKALFASMLDAPFYLSENVNYGKAGISGIIGSYNKLGDINLIQLLTLDYNFAQDSSLNIDFMLTFGKHDLLRLLELQHQRNNGLENVLFYNTPGLFVDYIGSERPLINGELHTGPIVPIFFPLNNYREIGGEFGMYFGFVFQPEKHIYIPLGDDITLDHKLESQFDPYFGINGNLGDGSIFFNLHYGPEKNYLPKTRGIKLGFGATFNY